MRSIERAMDLDRRRQEKLDAEAAEHAKELEGLRRESVAVAKRVQDHEAAASAAERRLADLERQTDAAEHELAAGRGGMNTTLAAPQPPAQRPQTGRASSRERVGQC